MSEQVSYRNPVHAAGHAILEHAITLDKRISAGAYRLFALYKMHAQQKDNAFPGRARLSEMLDVTEVTISRYNKELVDAGYITRERRIGTSSVTWIEDYDQNAELKRIALEKLSERKESPRRIIKDTTSTHSRHQRHITSESHKEKKEEKKEEKERASAARSTPLFVDTLSGLTITVYDEGHVEYAEVLLTEQSRDFFCPMCNAAHVWPKKESARKKDVTLTCSECGVLFEVQIESTDQVYRLTQVNKYAIIEIGKYRIESGVADAKRLAEVAKQNVGAVVDAVKWAADKGILSSTRSIVTTAKKILLDRTAERLAEKQAQVSNEGGTGTGTKLVFSTRKGQS